MLELRYFRNKHDDSQKMVLIFAHKICELKNFAKIFGYNIEVRSDLSEYIGLMNYISRTGLNLVLELNGISSNGRTLISK